MHKKQIRAAPNLGKPSQLGDNFINKGKNDVTAEKWSQLNDLPQLNDPQAKATAKDQAKDVAKAKAKANAKAKASN